MVAVGSCSTPVAPLLVVPEVDLVGVDTVGAAEDWPVHTLGDVGH